MHFHRVHSKYGDSIPVFFWLVSRRPQFCLLLWLLVVHFLPLLLWIKIGNTFFARILYSAWLCVPTDLAVLLPDREHFLLSHANMPPNSLQLESFVISWTQVIIHLEFHLGLSNFTSFLGIFILCCTVGRRVLLYAVIGIVANEWEYCWCSPYSRCVI